MIIRNRFSTKKGTVISVAVIVFCVVFAILFFLFSKKNNTIRNNNNALNSALQNVSSETATLDDIVPFSWDTAYTFSPYTSIEDMAETMGVDHAGLHESNYDDMINLVFVKEKAVVASICEHKNNLGYDIEFDTPVAMGDHTIFSIEKRDGILYFRR